MNGQFAKTTLATAVLMIGTLTSACANSGEQYAKTPASETTVTEGVAQLSPEVEEALTFSDSELAVVFAVDRDGRIQAFTTQDNKVAAREFPLPAGNIDEMETITTFKTSNPKVCWVMFGSLRCVSW